MAFLRSQAVGLSVADASITQRLAERVARLLQAHGIANLPVRVRAVESIAREPGVGKFKLVKADRARGAMLDPVA